MKDYQLLIVVLTVTLVVLFGSVGFFIYEVNRMDVVRAKELAEAKLDPANQIDMNVDRIFYHQPKEFTFVTLENDELKFNHWRGCEITWKQDAKAGEPIRLVGNKAEKKFVVHLHSAQEIGGADWQRRNGKYNVRGNTSVVE